MLLARVLFFSRTIFFRSAIMLFHALQPLGKQFLLPVEKGFGSRGRGAYRLPYNIGMPHVILHRYNDQTDPHYTEQTEPKTKKETRIQNSVRVLLPEFSLVLHLFVECVSPDVQIHI